MSNFIVVTGVSSGIGYELARYFVSRRYRVFGSVRSNEDGQRLAAELGPSFVPLCFDVTDLEAVQSAAQQVQAVVGEEGLGALVNNAGISVCGPLMHLPIDEIRALFEVNVLGVIQVTQAFLPLLGAKADSPHRPGRIVNVSSVSGAVTVPFFGAYAGTKHALEAVTQAFRRELKIYGIDVIAIEPGFVKTSMFKKTEAKSPRSRFSDTAYEPLWQSFQREMARMEDKAGDASTVVSAVHRALKVAKPKTRYPLDSLWWIGKLLSDRQFDRLIFRALGLTRALRDMRRTAPLSMGGANARGDIPK
ncbi:MULTISPECIES: SDR family oxidoreductase [Burkholderia]|uniref:SDR family oxidoreductase n=1 Tax=Burkholderia TaxID=32008 RepID=UPI0009B52D55|nr:MULTISPECIES: SDR family oxidoreductase [Burkholderia]RQS24188.1 SDR family oxidoreductase [Burkholderia sp. Bp8995]RQS38917.1 SDR family oxidoreductase [Burkholderia sp. Bp8989]